MSKTGVQPYYIIMNLYRKYRPQNFSDMVQQDFAVQTLKNTLITRRISHAFIFSGPRGTGKTSLAKVFSKALNCLDETSYEPCNKCKNCVDFNNNKFMDYFEIDAASNGKVDEMRDLIDKVKYVPTQGKYKIYVLDEAHMLSTGASNAFLKTLEEPPEHVIFIMATTEPHKILNTIRSRCQFFEFQRIGVKKIKERLSNICLSEDIKITEDALNYIAYSAEGGLRDALSILEQLWSFSEGNIDVDVINQVFGTISGEKILEFLEILEKKELQKVLEFTNSLYETGSDFGFFVDDVLKLLKDIIYFKWNSTSNEIMPFFKKMQSRILKIDDKLLFDVLNLLNTEYYNIKKSEDSKIAFELLIYRFLNKKEEVKVVTQVITQTESSSEPIKKKSVKAGERFKFSKKRKIDNITIENAFDLLIDEVDKESKFLASCLRAAVIKAEDSKKLLNMSFSSGYKFHYSKVNSNKKMLEARISALLDENITFDVKIEKDQKKEEISVSPENIKKDPEDDMSKLIESNDFLKKMTEKGLKIKDIKKI